METIDEGRPVNVAGSGTPAAGRECKQEASNAAAVAAPTSRCRNCATPWPGEWPGGRPAYCPACGQETRPGPPTVLEFLQQFGGNTIAPEGALWRTLRLLLFKPGALTAEYWAGRKRRYVLPVRLYLTISVLVLALMSLQQRVAPTLARDVEQAMAEGKGAARAAAEADPAAAKQGAARSAAEADPTAAKQDAPATEADDAGSARPGGRLTLGGGAVKIDGSSAGTTFECTGGPDWLCDRLKARYDVDPNVLRAELSRLPERVVSHWGTAMFLLLPTFALWMKLGFIGRGRLYAEHLVFALHVHAFWFLMVGAVALGPSWVAPWALLVVVGYAYLAAQRVYGGSRWRTLLRMTAVSALYGATVVVAIMVVVFWALIL